MRRHKGERGTEKTVVWWGQTPNLFEAILLELVV